MNYIRDIELLTILVSKDLKVRYKSNVLGYLWAIANPFAFALVYYIAFKLIMRIEMENYAIFLLSGMFPWMWLSNGLHAATSSLRNNASLIKHVNLPHYILPLSNITQEAIHFFFALPALTLFILLTGGDFYVSWLWQIPSLIILQTALILPFALMFALSNVFVHDVEHLVGIGLSMLFFLTPIVYPMNMIPENYAFYFELNPLASLIQLWRSVLLQGEFHLSYFILILTTTTITALLAFTFYIKTNKKIGELL